jgi:cytochrome c553
MDGPQTGDTQMKKFLISIAALGLISWHGFVLADDAAAMSETCMDCHELDEFKGKDAAELAEGYKKGIANNKMMAKATADFSAEDIQAIVAYLATEANK